jgi:hypothetical protein
MGKLVPLFLLLVIVMGCVAVLAQKSSTVQAVNGETLVELPPADAVEGALTVVGALFACFSVLSVLVGIMILLRSLKK